MSISTQNKIERSNYIEAFFEYAAMGIVITDKAGTITAINPFALNEFGYTKKELTGKKIEILIPSRFHEKHSQYHNKYIAKPVTRKMGIGMHLVAIKKDSTEFPVEISLNNYNHNGDSYVIAFINNITLQKRAEAKIEKLNNELENTVKQRTGDLNEALKQLKIVNVKLEEAISYQKAILDNAGAMIIATDEKGMIRLFNPEAVANIGYSQSEVIGKRTPLIFHDKNEINGVRKKIFEKYGLMFEDDFSVMVENAKRNIHEEEQYTYIRKDGTTFPVSLTITAIRDNNSEIKGFMGVSINISERKKAEVNLREALEKEKELGELKSRFVSMASHEFRTPLSTVLSSAYLIEKYIAAEDQPKRERHLHRIISSVNMLTDILNDFLSVGKMEEGKIQVRITRFNIQELIRAISGELKNSLKKLQKIHYHHQGKPDVLMDASLLKHIIMNLVSNASKFSPESGPIQLKTSCHDNQVTLSVKDNGIGISKEDQKHLMERFFRGANAGTIQGTGLGLHIVSKYAELMNGTVECKSELEKGTEFIITFNSKTGML